MIKRRKDVKRIIGREDEELELFFFFKQKTAYEMIW